MTSWAEFTQAAPRIAEIFIRRHAATGNLCLLATLPSDGFPRVSPIEPRVFEGELWLTGMPGTTKFRDLARDPRFCLHTAIVDTNVSDGDANCGGPCTTSRTRPCTSTSPTTCSRRRASTCAGSTSTRSTPPTSARHRPLEVGGGHLDITIWQPGGPERVVRKH